MRLSLGFKEQKLLWRGNYSFLKDVRWQVWLQYPVCCFPLLASFHTVLSQVGCSMFATGNKPDVQDSSRLSHQPQHICPEATPTQHCTQACPSLISVVNKYVWIALFLSIKVWIMGGNTNLSKFKSTIYWFPDLLNFLTLIHLWIMELKLNKWHGKEYSTH